MDPETKQELIRITIEKYHQYLCGYKKEVIEDFKKIKCEKDESRKQQLLSIFKNKHKLFPIRNNTKEETINNYHCKVHEFLNKDDNNPIGKYKFTDEEKKLIIEYCIKKIRGIYKMAQSMKTGYCNSLIMNSISKKNITFAITKNTLEANEQWLLRIMKDLDHRFPLVSTRDKIMIISSKKNDLNGNATHCKNIEEAWMILSKENNYSVVFVCSNGKRISDIYSIIENIDRLKDNLKKKVDVIHDEGHNTREGIPAYRNIIENIIAHPLVDTFIPCTASIGDIIDDTNPLWLNSNLTKYAKDFSEFDQTKSDDPNYSSISDSNKITFEELKKNANWEDVNIEEVSRELFIECDEKYNGRKKELTTKDYEDIDKRRKLEFSRFQKHQQEKLAIKYGINALNMNNLLNIDYFQKDIFNLHIISTPCRKIITRYLAIEATKKDYNPIVLSIYGSEGDKYHMLYDGKKRKYDKIMTGNTFNDKLLGVIKHLNKKGISTERPFIIIGNYYPTGESLSFVHSEYGTVRGNIRLISTTAEEDYQEACRSNYMLNKFKEDHGDDWKQPEKWLVGERKFIYNAELYEKDNDERLDGVKGNINNKNQKINIVISKKHEEKDGMIAPPVKLQILDEEDETVDQIIEIMKSKSRTKEDKKIFMGALKQAVEAGNIEITDPYGKFSYEFELKGFRCYGSNERGRRESAKLSTDWKFASYQSHFKGKTPFMNNKNDHKKNQCELLCSSKLFKDTNSKGEVIKNPKHIFWISYKY